MESKRLDYPDMVKGIGIFLVVLGHINYVPGPLRIWISCYHMPVFFVLSGIMMGMKEDRFEDLSSIIRHKARGILVPYFWFSLSYFVLDIGNLYLDKIDYNTFISNIISSVTFYGKSVLWFLPALFLTQVYYILLRRRLSVPLTCAAVVVITIIAYFCKIKLDEISFANAESIVVQSVVNFFRTFVRAAVALPFTAVGCIVQRILLAKADSDSNDSGKMAEFIRRYINPGIKERMLMIIAGTTFLAIVYPICMMNGCVDLHNIILGNAGLYYLAAFLGSYGLILLCKGIPSSRVIKYYGKNSLIVMASHLDYYILWASLVISMKVIEICKTDSQLLFLCSTVVLVFIMTIVVIEGINRLFPFVMGRKRIVKEKK